ncbi:MAG TPA: PAS domain-containing sensor histidine kinase [Ktedonobacterales bacterium]|nr:PAS domain-containing sensor histidine kinase [Ktedonobacterales bacterium]
MNKQRLMVSAATVSSAVKKTRPKRTNALMDAAAPIPLESLLSQTLLEVAPDAIVVCDATGRILLVNHQTEQLFGYARSALLGQPVEHLLPDRFHHSHERHRATYVDQPHTRPMGAGLALFGRCADGAEFPVEVSLSPLPFGNGTTYVIASVRDITARRLLEQRAQATFQAQLRLLQTVIAALPCAVAIVRGRDARLVLANQMIEMVWGGAWAEGITLAECHARLGVSIHDKRQAPIPLERLASLEAVRTGQPCLHRYETIYHADGSHLAVLASAFPLNPAILWPTEQTPAPSDQTDGGRIRDGQMASWLSPVEPLAMVVFEDVTSLREAERIKDEFIALAAHELRTPMAALLGFAQMLQPGLAKRTDAAALADWQQEALENILESAQRLVALTDDLLDVTRLQAGRLELHPEPSDLGALARRVLRRLRPLAGQTHTFQLTAPNDEVVVTIDESRIEQVLSNLVQNAIKYSPGGGEIAITLTTHAATSMARLTVQDHGIGIPVADQPRLFGRFERAENARKQQIEGTGLGLFVCRELVELHGGLIWFDSVEGQGTTFYLTQPLTLLDSQGSTVSVDERTAIT